MKNKLDELTKGLARSVTRRPALRRFGVGIAAVALTVLGLAGVFGLFEPAAASAKVVTSGDVRLVSERIVTQPDAPAYGKNGKCGKFEKSCYR